MEIATLAILRAPLFGPKRLEKKSASKVFSVILSATFIRLIKFMPNQLLVADSSRASRKLHSGWIEGQTDGWTDRT